MTQRTTTMPPEYRTLLRQWNEYVKRSRYGLTDEERVEMDALAAQLESYEEAKAKELNTIALASSDYDQCRMIGDLGGTEL